MNEDIKLEIEKLMNDRVWVTKKVRMEAEARMNFYNIFTQILVIYYTFFVLAFSILSLVFANDGISLMTVIASVGLFGISIFVSAIGYREKAIQYKVSYISLNELEFNLKSLLRNPDMDYSLILEKFKEYETKYNEILNVSENHSIVDYLKIRMRKNTDITSKDKFKYYSIKILTYSIGVVLIIAPIIMCIIYLRS